MGQVRCPACRVKVVVEAVVPGTELTCERCGQQWVVSTVTPLRSEDDLEESIEELDCPVRSRFRGPFRAGL